MVAPPFLQSLERRDHLLAGSIAARPQPQLPPPRTLEHRQLDPQLGDRCARLPFLDPRADEAEQLRRAAQRMTHDSLALLGQRGFELQPHAHLRSEEHTSELQSLAYLVCRLLLEKKKKKINNVFLQKKKKKRKKKKKKNADI